MFKFRYTLMELDLNIYCEGAVNIMNEKRIKFCENVAMLVIITVFINQRHSKRGGFGGWCFCGWLFVHCLFFWFGFGWFWFYFGHSASCNNKTISFKLSKILTFCSSKMQVVFFSMKLNFQQFHNNR